MKIIKRTSTTITKSNNKYFNKGAINENNAQNKIPTKTIKRNAPSIKYTDILKPLTKYMFKLYLIFHSKKKKLKNL